MTHRLTNNYAKNYCNQTLIVREIIVTFFLGGGHIVEREYMLTEGPTLEA